MKATRQRKPHWSAFFGLLIVIGFGLGISFLKPLRPREDRVAVVGGVGELVKTSDPLRTPSRDPWRIFRGRQGGLSQAAKKRLWLEGDPDQPLIDLLDSRGVGRSYMRGYPDDARIREIEETVAACPDSFYAKFYLAGIYLAMKRYEDAKRLREEALAAAPLVLEIPVRFDRETNAFGLNGWNHLEQIRALAPLGFPLHPFRSMDSQQRPELDFEVEPARLTTFRLYRYRTQGGRLMATQPYVFENTPVDLDGIVRIPFYPGRFTMASSSMPRLRFSKDSGLPCEMLKLSSQTFEARYSRTRLPTLWVWERYSPSPKLTRSAAESAILHGMTGGPERTKKINEITVEVDWTARADATGNWRFSDLNGSDPSALPTVATNFINSVDHATIQLSTSAPDRSRVDWFGIQVLDSRTKIPLTDFRYGAGFYTDAPAARLHLVALWEALPDAIDVVLPIFTYYRNRLPVTMGAHVGAEARGGDGWGFRITSLHAGEYEEWSDTEGFVGAWNQEKPVTQIVVETMFEGNDRLDLFVLDQEGRAVPTRLHVYAGGAKDEPRSQTMATIEVPLDRIRGFEWRPFQADSPSRVYFESISLPNIDRPLVEQEIRLRVPMGAVVDHAAVSDLAPLRVNVFTDSVRRSWYAGMRKSGIPYVEPLHWLQHTSERRDAEFRNGGVLIYEVNALIASQGINPIFEPQVSFDFVRRAPFPGETEHPYGRWDDWLPTPKPFPYVRNGRVVMGTLSEIETIRDWRYTVLLPFRCSFAHLSAIDIRLSPRPWFRRNGQALHDYLIHHSPAVSEAP